ncbi:MAG TPA: hypothetical protein VIK54_10890 [Acidimicrobiia bacterium]
MWFGRPLAVVGLVVALAAADVLVAAEAGAALAPASPTAAVGAPISRRSESSPRPAPIRTRRVAAVVPKVRVRTPPAPPVKPKLVAAKPPVTTAAPPTTTCSSVVASVVWPPAWHAICTGGRSGILGLTAPSGTTTLYIRPGESDSFLRVVALHEAGHAWDFARLDAAKIGEWCAARGCDAAHFFSGGAHGAGWSEPGGAEDWASSWDACHGGDYHRSYLGLPAPSSALCTLQNELVGYPV